MPTVSLRKSAAWILRPSKVVHFGRHRGLTPIYYITRSKEKESKQVAHPEWVLKHKVPNSEIRCIRNRYYLYKITSVWCPEKKRTNKKIENSKKTRKSIKNRKTWKSPQKRKN